MTDKVTDVYDTGSQIAVVRIAYTRIMRYSKASKRTLNLHFISPASRRLLQLTGAESMRGDVKRCPRPVSAACSLLLSSDDRRHRRPVSALSWMAPTCTLYCDDWVSASTVA